MLSLLSLSLSSSLWLLCCVAPANACGAEGAAEQQQMVEHIHAMIGDLEVEKQSFLATMNSQQVQCLFLHSSVYAAVATLCGTSRCDLI